MSQSFLKESLKSQTMNFGEFEMWNHDFKSHIQTLYWNYDFKSWYDIACPNAVLENHLILFYNKKSLNYWYIT